MKTIAVDFDGVIHKYGLGYLDGTIYDRPLEGSEEALKKLLESYCVIIFSTRKPETIKKWMLKKMEFIPVEVIPDDVEFEWKKQGVVGITNRKLKAFMYVDDRAVRFTNWKDILNYVR